MRNRLLYRHINISVILLVILLLTSCEPSLQREPEIPINHILQTQFEILSDGWEFTPVRPSEIETDTDFTWALWTVWDGFDRQDPREGNIDVEFHVFTDLQRAQLIPASSAELNYTNGFVPEEWGYAPSDADRFEFECAVGEYKYRLYDLICEATFRYQEYVIYITAPIADYFTLQDFQRLLEVTDQEMADFLENSTLRPGVREVPTRLD